MKLVTLLKLIEGNVNIVFQSAPGAFKPLCLCADSKWLLHYERRSLSGLDVIFITSGMKNDVEPLFMIYVKESAK